MCSPEINEGELRGQPANPGSPGKMGVKTECVCVFLSGINECHFVRYVVYIDAQVINFFHS